MAINPNTDFTTGAVLTAAQQNRFPRGVVAYQQGTTTVAVGAAEVVTVTSTTFTAVANRYYKITYYEPAVNPPTGATNYIFLRLRLTGLGGTQLQISQVQESGASGVANNGNCQVVTTLTPGSTTIVGTGQANAAGGNVFRTATQIGFIVVEDIGPA